MKESTTLIAVFITLFVAALAFFCGAIWGAGNMADIYKERAIKHSAARWVIDDQAKGTTRFEWINPEVEK